MTDVFQPSLSEQDSLDERLSLLVDDFDLAMRWERASILTATYASEYVRSDSLTLLENQIMDRGWKTGWIHMDDPDLRHTPDWIENFKKSADTVYFADGLGNLLNDPIELNSKLNRLMDLIRTRRMCVVFWLTKKEITALVRISPEFWIARHHLFDLVASPKPEQILQTALESAWHGIGEYDGEYADTEAKISLRESFLSELPCNTESASIRANLLLNLGILNWRRGEYEKASETLQEALKFAARLQDNWFEAQCFNAVALVSSSLGKNDEAIDAYKQAIELAPEQIFAWNNLGNLCLKIARNDEAMIAFQKAIHHNPADPIAWNGLGDVYSRRQYPDDAIAAYRKSIECAPLLPHPWNGLGEVYAGMSRIDEAVTAFQKAIELNPHFVTPCLRLAELFAGQQRYREALKAYQQALFLDSKNSRIWNDLGVVYLNAGKIGEAVDSFMKAIDLDRGFGWAYSNLGLAYTSDGKPAESLAPYLKSLELLTDEIQKSATWNRLANSYRLLNEYEKAIQAYQRADSLQAEPFTDLYPESNDVEAASAAEANPPSKTGPSQPDEGSDLELSETIISDIEPATDDDPPFWIFQPSGDRQSMESYAVVSEAPRSRKSSPWEGEAVSTSTVEVAFDEKINSEIGGRTMQISIPMFSNFATHLNSLSILKQETEEEVVSQPEPARASVWNEMGNIHFLAGAYEKAIHAYNKALALDRSFGWAYCNLGITYLTLERYAESISLLQKSIELLKDHKDRAVAWNGLGNLYRLLNDYDNAVVAYQKADELDPSHAGIRDEAGHFNDAAHTEDAQGWVELGDLLFNSSSYREASKCYQKAADLEPDNGAAYSNLALSFTYQAKFREAVPLYLKSIELLHDDKEKAISWNRLGNVYRRLNEYENAVAAYRNAVNLNREPMTLVSRARFSLLGNCQVD